MMPCSANVRECPAHQPLRYPRRVVGYGRHAELSLHPTINDKNIMSGRRQSSRASDAGSHLSAEELDALYPAAKVLSFDEAMSAGRGSVGRRSSRGSVTSRASRGSRQSGGGAGAAGAHSVCSHASGRVRSAFGGWAVALRVVADSPAARPPSPAAVP